MQAKNYYYYDDDVVRFKDVHPKIFHSTFFFNFYCSQIMSYMYLCQKCKKIGVTDFVSEIKHVENYPDFEKLVHVIQHGLQGFVVKNIEG